MKKLLASLIFFLFFHSIIGFAQTTQTRILSGKVFLEGVPIAGATISFDEDPTIKSSTNLQGDFELEVPKDVAFTISVNAFIDSEQLRNIKIKKNEKDVEFRIKGKKLKKIVNEKIK